MANSMMGAVLLVLSTSHRKSVEAPTIALENSQDLVASDDFDLGDAVAVS